MADTQAACMNFLNALERIPEVIKSHQERAEKLRVDLPTLQAIAARTWGKEDELKALKAELATLDQKITAELAPKQDKQDFGEEIKLKDTSNPAEYDEKSPEHPTDIQNENKSMVAESICPYNVGINNPKYSRIFKF